MPKAPRTTAGFAVEEPGSIRLVTIYPTSDTRWGHPFTVKRTLAPAFQHLIDSLDLIEPVAEKGWDGGYAHRIKRLADGLAAPDDWSEHAAGAGIDWNASQHPQNSNRFQGWSGTQVAQINRFLDSHLGQVFEWGADWHHSDPMHFQIATLDGRGARRWADTWVHFNWPTPNQRPHHPPKVISS